MADSRACCPSERCLIKPQSKLGRWRQKQNENENKQTNMKQPAGKKTEKENKQTNKHQHRDLLERYLMKP